MLCSCFVFRINNGTFTKIEEQNIYCSVQLFHFCPGTAIPIDLARKAVKFHISIEMKNKNLLALRKIKS